MKKRPSNKQSSGKPLKGHTKVGKILRPDFMVSTNFQFSRYVDDVLPEIIGIAFLIDAHGYRRAAELTYELALALQQQNEKSMPIISSMEHIGEEKMAAVRAALFEKGMLEELSVAFAPLNIALGPTPLNCFDLAPIVVDDAVKRLRNCVDRNFNRYGQEASAALATLYYTQARLGKVHINQGLRIPDLDSIITDPESDAAQHAKSSVRMYSMIAIGHLREEVPAIWAAEFWHRCYLVAECKPWEFDDAEI